MSSMLRGFRRLGGSACAEASPIRPGRRARMQPLVGGALLLLGAPLPSLAQPLHPASPRPPAPAAPKKEAPPPGLGRSAAAAAPSPERTLERAKLAYQRGDYAAAVAMLRPLLYPQTLLSAEDQVLLAHRLLAISSLFEHDETGSEQEFNLLLSLRPDFALDPVVDPLQAVAFLDDIRRRNEQRLQEIRRRQAEEEQRRKAEAEQLAKQAEELAKKQTRVVYYERTVQRRFSAVDLLPLGIPQLASKRRGVGAALFTTELVLGGASLSTWITVQLRYPNRQFPAKEYVTAQALTGTYLATGVAFWGLVAYGLIDALLHARTQTTVRELSAPPKDLTAASGTTAPAASLGLGSDARQLQLDGTAALGVQFAF